MIRQVNNKTLAEMKKESKGMGTEGLKVKKKFDMPILDQIKPIPAKY